MNVIKWITQKVKDLFFCLWVAFYLPLTSTSIPFYGKILHIIFFPIVVLHEIGRIEINLFPKKFKTWEMFEEHLEKIIISLRQNNEIDWAQRLYESKHVSQSSWEVLYAILDVLKSLEHYGIAKQIKQRKQIKKGILYLESFR